MAAAFSAVNESTWEHMKLLFFPVFFFSVIQVCFLGRNYPNVLSARATGTLAGLVLIPCSFTPIPVCSAATGCGRTLPCF